MSVPKLVTRRQFVTAAGALGGAALAASALPLRVYAQTAASARPQIPYGVQTGDVTADRAVIWAATDRPARMLLEYATSDTFANARAVRAPDALPESGFAAKAFLGDLPAGEDIFYSVRFLDLGDLKTMSAPVTGRFRTAPRDNRDVSFVFTGDTCGQGWGINTDWGGMRAYETMRLLQPDFMIHSGDMIYADGPLKETVTLADGTVWKNLVTPEKSKVAETLDEFRGQYKYNMMDENVRRFNGEVAQYVQWDDHEVTNNWFWQRRYEGDERYQVKSAALLAARARRAMFEFTPLDIDANESQRVYRAFHRGPLLDVFRIDMRSYRGANGANDQTEISDEARILGAEQLHWLKQQLLASRATWKIIAADMPIGLIVWHDSANKAGSEAVAQGDGPPRGRELEFADLLSFIKRNNIANVHFVTADVHYCATHRYTPENAQFTDFRPFYEFVSGPIHAGGFGPNALDNTFGPEVTFTANPGGVANTPPTSGGLYFCHAKIDGRSKAMTVSHRNVFGTVLSEITLEPEAA